MGLKKIDLLTIYIFVFNRLKYQHTALICSAKNRFTTLLEDICAINSCIKHSAKQRYKAEYLFEEC